MASETLFFTVAKAVFQGLQSRWLALVPTHEHFDGISLTRDGRELTLDYSDHFEPGPKLFSHYIFSLHALPKLVTGNSPHTITSERTIAYNDIPDDVLGDACDWLKSKIGVAAASRKEYPHRILVEHLAVLRGRKFTLEPSANTQRGLWDEG
jgi:hypothetical protein